MGAPDVNEAEDVGRSMRRRLDELAETQHWVHHVGDLDSGEVRDLLEAGIVDSAGVVCAALESAAYVAKRLVSTEVLIVQPIYAGKYAGTAAEGGPANLTMR